ncbi:MAG: hypothetical protein HQL32_13255, partial [Planctomycetes bacterium]|nr:hypothetical protein [Planctomycetota bacterium]
ECMEYIDLNPLRAGMVTRPEDHKYSAFRERSQGNIDGLLSLQELLNTDTEEEAFAEYRASVYFRGEVKSKESDKLIDKDVINQELARDFEPIKKRKWRFMTDGLAIGPPELIENFLKKLRDRGVFKSRHNPVPIAQYKGEICSLREQRNHGCIGKDAEENPMWLNMGLEK